MQVDLDLHENVEPVYLFTFLLSHAKRQRNS